MQPFAPVPRNATSARHTVRIGTALYRRPASAERGRVVDLERLSCVGTAVDWQKMSWRHCHGAGHWKGDVIRAGGLVAMR